MVNQIIWTLNKIKYNLFIKETKKYVNDNGIIFDIDKAVIPITTKIYGDSNLKICDGMKLSDNVVIDAHDSFGIYIGNNFLAAPDVYIRGGNHDYSFSELPFTQRGHCAKKIEFSGKIYSIVIEDNVWIGRGATILSGAHIEKGCVIGAGAVVKSHIPGYSIVIGNPAQVVSNRRKYSDFDDRDDIGVFE